MSVLCDGERLIAVFGRDDLLVVAMVSDWPGTLAAQRKLIAEGASWNAGIREGRGRLVAEQITV